MSASRLPGLAFRHRSALLALVATLAAATALWARQPFDVPTVAAGVGVTLLGSALRLAAMRAIGKRARVNHACAAELLQAGPYGRVRNPLYVANIAIACGLVCIGGGWASAGALLVGCALVYAPVVRHEEAWLSGTFGDAYRDYAARVPRWLPRLRGPAAPIAEPVAWPEVLGREFRLVLGVPLAVAGLVAYRGYVAPLSDWLAAAAAPTRLPVPVLLIIAGALGALGNAVSVERKLRRKDAIRAALDPEAQARV